MSSPSSRLPVTISVLLFLLVVWIQITEGSLSERLARKCHSAYYTPPKCIDHPDGYGCDCGPGFHWNTKICMSTAVDSRLEFKKQTPVRYTLLLGKAFPKLSEFTIAFWIRVVNPKGDGTILSYKHNERINLLHMRSGPQLWFKIYDEEVYSNVTFTKDTWYHVVWTWGSSDGRWSLYINGNLHNSCLGNQTVNPVPLGGEFVLGQSSRRTFKFNETLAFVGDIAHLNIWTFEVTQEEVLFIKDSCTIMYCGDAVQWTEFRSGTRGAMRMRWPSEAIRGQCYSEDDVGVTCNKHCSNKIGAQCNEETVENIVWSRTPAINNISVPCPEDQLQGDVPTFGNSTGFGTRPCYRTTQNEGEWGEADIDNCISHHLRQLKYKFQRLLLGDYIGEDTLLTLGRELLNHTLTAYGNPVDVATVIDLLEMLVDTQAEVIVLKVSKWSDGNRTYAKAEGDFPTLEETHQFMEIVADVVNNILHQRHDPAWNATKPPGTEGDNLMKVVDTFSHVLARSLQNHVTDGDIGGPIGYEEAFLKVARSNFDFSVEAQWVQDFRGTRFPAGRDKSYGMQMSLGTIELPKKALDSSNQSDLPVFLKISSMRLSGIAEKLPNHDSYATGKKAKEDNVNTPILALFIHNGVGELSSNLSAPIIFTLPYLDTFNISNPECVRLLHGTIIGGRITQWKWTRDGCDLVLDRGTEGVCACSVTGMFAITTDMYNVNWNKGEVRPILMNFASYIGCSASAFLCLLTCILHIYFRTSSSTAALHKNLSISIVLGQLVFMMGIDRYDNELVCQIFAVALHYFFLTNFSWLMNEAFNLYIVITYSSHAHGQHSDSGSLLRYYILGWVIPGVLVGAFVGSQGEAYYAKDMCWVSWDNLWLFVGPAVGIIVVTIMVMIFTAKEHNENSYTKSEKSNKFISYIMKAIWTQIILITVVWSFAFISLKMSDRILKYLFGLFNSLQGSFFIVFYLLLNEEARSVFKNKKKKKTLTSHGFDDPDDRSLDSQASTHLVEKERLDSGEARPRRRKEYVGRRKRKQRLADIEMCHEDEEPGNASDCEMITSV